MSKIFLVLFLILFNLSLSLAKDIDFSGSDINLSNAGFDQGAKIQFTADFIFPAKSSSILIQNEGEQCRLRFREEKPFLRMIKKGTIVNIEKYFYDKDGYYDWYQIIMSSGDHGIDEFACSHNMRIKDFIKLFENQFKILVPEPVIVTSAIKIPKNKKNKDTPQIKAEEVVQKLPQACVYIGMWKESQQNQLPNLSKNAKEYLDTLIPILRGTFKSLNNIECDTIPKEKLVEAAIKLSEDKNINDNSRNMTKSKKSGHNNKAKGHTSKNI